MKNIEIVPADIAASFQKAVTDVLIAHAMHAAETFEINKLAIAGGVASNSVLREGMRAACEKRGISCLLYTSKDKCTVQTTNRYNTENGTDQGSDSQTVGCISRFGIAMVHFLLTLRDIVGELEKPGRDPREDMPKPILRTDCLLYTSRCV